MYRDKAEPGDYGKLDYHVEKWCPELFAQVWHHNGEIVNVVYENGVEMLDVVFCKVNNGKPIRIKSSYFDNFTRKYGIKKNRRISTKHHAIMKCWKLLKIWNKDIIRRTDYDGAGECYAGDV